MKVTLCILSLLLLSSTPGWAENPSSPEKINPSGFYNFTVDSIYGKPVELKTFKGKVVLIVNTASHCGYTPQYKQLTELYNKYKDKGLEILGFPANNFGQQEPGSNEEIEQFCTTKFAVQFPLFTKVSVAGKEQHPLFQYLTSAENPDFKGEIKWNFEKFLIGRDGKLLHRYRSKITPLSQDLIIAIEEALKTSE